MVGFTRISSRWQRNWVGFLDWIFNFQLSLYTSISKNCLFINSFHLHSHLYLSFFLFLQQHNTILITILKATLKSLTTMNDFLTSTSGTSVGKKKKTDESVTEENNS